MARWRAFDRLTSVPKQRFSDEVILFADADGAFKAVDEDGVVSALAGAGSLPNPTDEGDVLTVVDGSWGGAPSGGSQPDANSSGQGDVLTVETAAETTWAAIFAALPELHQSGWQATHDYSADVSWGAATDVPVYLTPDGVTNTYAAEVTSGTLTGGSEPDWDGDAPNLGDTLSDGAVTWVNAGPLGDFPAPESMWQADHEYDLPAALYLNGQGYVIYPPGGGTSGAVKPEFPTDGSYVQDGAPGNYWYNVGPVAQTVDAVLAWDPLDVSDLPAPMVVTSTDNAVPAFTAMNTSDIGATAPQINAVNAVADDGGIWLRQLDDASGKFGGSGVGAVDFDVETQLQSFAITGLSVRYLGGGDIGLFSGLAADLVEPADNELVAGQFCLWFDATNGAAKIKFKAKQANGTVVTGEVALSV